MVLRNHAYIIRDSKLHSEGPSTWKKKIPSPPVNIYVMVRFNAEARAKDRDRWPTLVNAVMNLRIP